MSVSIYYLMQYARGIELINEFKILDLYPIILEKLRNGGTVILPAAGTSMQPMVKSKRDSLEIAAAAGRLKKNDLPLYRRDDGQFVMHRIVGFDKNGAYVMCGDNQFAKEHHIREDQIIGVAKGFTRENSYISCDRPGYRLYCMALPVSRFSLHCLRICIWQMKKLIKVFGQLNASQQSHQKN